VSENTRASSDLYQQAMAELVLPAPATKTLLFRQLDILTGGFRPREFTILCGATGIGKTCLLANLSTAFLQQKAQQFVASVETGATDFMKRIFSVLEGKDLNHGDMVDVEILKGVHAKWGYLFQNNTLRLSLYENRFSVEQLISDIQYEVKNHGCKIAMIDNLNFFLEVTSAQDSIIEMDRVIHKLIIFCKQVDVHVVMVMHPRKVEAGRVESELDIKGSSTAVQEAHNVFLFNRPHKDLIDKGLATSGDRELKMAKMRRRGKNVGRTLLFKCTNGVSYSEGVVL
jgi:twinkle protein